MKYEIIATQEVHQIWNSKVDKVRQNAVRSGMFTQTEIDNMSISIKQNKKGSCAGDCTLRAVDAPIEITLNEQLKGEHQVWDTLGHELAHALVYYKYRVLGRMPRGRSPKGHGREWQWMSTNITESDPARCHQYENVQKVRKTKQYEYILPHKKVLVGAIRHKRIQEGCRRYSLGQVTLQKHHYSGNIVVK